MDFDVFFWGGELGFPSCFNTFPHISHISTYFPKLTPHIHIYIYIYIIYIFHISIYTVWLRKRTVNREPNRSGTGRLRTGTNRTANYSYANRMGTNRTANYSYANRMEPNRFHILKKVILSASGGSENDFRELKIKLERGINCNEWIPAQHNLPKCCRNCK